MLSAFCISINNIKDKFATLINACAIMKEKQTFAFLDTLTVFSADDMEKNNCDEKFRICVILRYKRKLSYCECIIQTKDRRK